MRFRTCDPAMIQLDKDDLRSQLAAAVCDRRELLKALRGEPSDYEDVPDATLADLIEMKELQITALQHDLNSPTVPKA